MNRPALLFGILLGCGTPSAPEVDAHGHHDEPHVDEPAHAPMLRRVRLDAQLIADIGIRMEPVRREAIAPTAHIVGELEADPDRTADVPARIAGTITRLDVQLGDLVARGQTLAVIRAPGLGALRSRKTTLQARIAAADANAKRLKGLAERRLASEQELLSANAELEALRAELSAASQQLRVLEVGRGKAGDPLGFAVMAPAAGVIVHRPAVVGAPVDESSVLATIVALDEMWFSAHVFERDLARIEVGAEASVHVNAYPDERFPGRVDRIAHAVDAGARTVTARIRVANRDGRLRLGLFGTADVAVGGTTASTPVLSIPASAVTMLHDQTVVFVRHPDDDFEVHEVVLGRRGTARVEVLQGLREGEAVVTEGAFNLKSILLQETLDEDHH